MKNLLIEKKTIFKLSLILLISTAIATIIQLVKGTLFQYAIDRNISRVYMFIVLFCLLIIFELTFYYIEWIFEAKITAKAMENLKNGVFRSSLFSKKKENEEVTNLITNQINDLEYDYFYSLYNLIYLIFRVILVVTIIFFINIYIGIVILFFMLLPLLFLKITGQKLNDKNVELLKKRENLLSNVQLELINLFPTNVFKIQKDRINKIAQYTLEERKSQFAFAKLESKTNLLNSILSYGSHFFIFSLAVIFIANGEMEAGITITLLGLVEQLSMPLVSISRNINAISSTSDIRKMIASKIQDESKSNEIRVSNKIYTKDLKITLSNFEKSYPDFEFLNGKKYLIQGKSGIGKSLFFKTLIGYNEDYEGSIIYDDYQLMIGENVFEDVCYIDSELNLYDNDTLSYNMIFNDSEEVFKNKNIARILDGLSNQHRVSDLSTGQKRRMIVLRGLLSKKKFTIYDEPTSNLDDENKENILLELLKSPNCVIIISHDISSEMKKNFDIVYEVL